MNVINFIQENGQLLSIIIGGVLVLLLFIWAIISNSSYKKNVKETVDKVFIEEASKEENINTTEEIPPIQKKTPKQSEARIWWNTLSVPNKKLYAFDAQLGEKKLSSLTNEDIELIQKVFLENNTITTK